MRFYKIKSEVLFICVSKAYELMNKQSQCQGRMEKEKGVGVVMKNQKVT